MNPSAQALEAAFLDCFAGAERTRLLGGASEPLYSPARSAGDWHHIYYRHDYAASALHEVAHWCIAGPARRTLADYGYWYAPDGRDRLQQCAFEAVEARPQGLEWLFSQACGLDFRLSFDNLDGDPPQEHRKRFAERVAAAAQGWRQRGPGGRAGRFVAALRRRFPAGCDVAAMRFCIAKAL